MARLLLTGANGQLAADIQEVFSGNSRYTLTMMGREQADLALPGSAARFIGETGEFDCLINCAAMTNTEECEKDKLTAYLVNTLAVREMAAFCQAQEKLFIHFSTDYIFDGTKAAPYVEEDEPCPLNVYGQTKLWGERAVLEEASRYLIFRVSSLFGRAGKSGSGINFVEKVLSRAYQGQELAVVCDQVMSPTHTLDVARMLMALLEQGYQRYGIYHFASSGFCTWYEFTREIFSLMSMPVAIRPVSADCYPAGLRRPSFSALGSGKIKEIFPPKHWREALTEYLFLRGYLP